MLQLSITCYRVVVAALFVPPSAVELHQPFRGRFEDLLKATFFRPRQDDPHGLRKATDPVSLTSWEGLGSTREGSKMGVPESPFPYYYCPVRPIVHRMSLDAQL